MKLLSSLLDNLTEKNTSPDIQISSITNNSRDVTEGTLFIAYPGEKSDGRKYIAQAIEKGAAAILYEPSDDFLPENKAIPCIPVFQLKTKQSLIAARFYDYPSRRLSVIGVTGTNGKTSTTHFIASALQGGTVIGTIGYGFLDQSLIKTINTTPDGLQLQKIFAELAMHGAKTVAMEVSSHALSQERVNDVDFHAAVFTNLTQDHLDFHGTMEHYRDAKELLFKNLRQGLPAIINIDDPVGQYYADKYRDHLSVVTYAVHNHHADITVEKCIPTVKGFDLTVNTPWGRGELHCPLIGTFNIENILAVLGVLGVLGMPFSEIVEKLSQLNTVHGRMQLFYADHQPHVIVDYAHTPDALEKALLSIKSHCHGKLICVFGCGGDRDKTKRATMGCIAEQCADQIIITNDNPRTENPASIVQDILSGMKNKTACYIELDRDKAIAHAIQTAGENDWILVAGKGHEMEQIIGDKILMHNDGECVIYHLRKK